MSFVNQVQTARDVDKCFESWHHGGHILVIFGATSDHFEMRGWADDDMLIGSEWKTKDKL